METRKITIVSSRTQTTSVVETAATTLGELKTALTAKGIDYTDQVFYEGVSHTTLERDDAVLPHDVPYKGQTTNELVFMLTTANKKIKSGANVRGSLYDKIREYGLEEVCKEEFGKNFTQCSNEMLLSVIEEHEPYEAPVVEELSQGSVDVNLRKRFNAFIDWYYNHDGNPYYDVLDFKISVPDVSDSPYSAEDIQEMFQ